MGFNYSDFPALVKAKYFLAVIAALVLGAIVNTATYFATGIYLPDVFGMFALLYALALLVAITHLLSIAFFRFGIKDSYGLAFAYLVLILCMGVAWKLAAEFVGYDMGGDLAAGLPYALIGVAIYFAALFATLPAEKAAPQAKAKAAVPAAKKRKR